MLILSTTIPTLFKNPPSSDAPATISEEYLGLLSIDEPSMTLSVYSENFHLATKFRTTDVSEEIEMSPVLTSSTSTVTFESKSFLATFLSYAGRNEMIVLGTLFSIGLLLLSVTVHIFVRILLRENWMK